MKKKFEIIGAFIISFLLTAIPILCPLSFVYNWFVSFKLILIVACLVEWVGLASLLVDIADKYD